MSGVFINDQLSVGNAAGQLSRVHSGYHDVAVAVGNKGWNLYATEILRRLATPSSYCPQLSHER